MAGLLPSSKYRLPLRGALNLTLLLAAAVFFALHAFHIDADFPNHSPWMDWAKYTDEGWYGDAAIRHFQRGHWHVPGDFNPAAALPVWPFLESIVFHFTGVTLTAARALTVAIFALILIASYLLLRRSSYLSTIRPAGEDVPASNSVTGAPSLAPAIAVLLLAASPFVFVFTRLAILEPLLILLTLLALLAITYIQPPASEKKPGHRIMRLLPSILLGLLVPLMVLTKTTAVFLMPALAWLLWARAGYSLRPFFRISLMPAAIAAAVWLTYYLALVRPHFLEDYRYLFAANAYTGITAATAIGILSDTIRDGLWMGKIIYPLALLAILVAVLTPRLSRRNPLIPTLIFWASGYMAFLAYHNNLQPRYYLVVAVPLTLLVPTVFAGLSHLPSQRSRLRSARAETSLQTHPLAFGALSLALLVAVVLDASQTIGYVRAPEYTFINAAAQIQQIIAAEQRRDPNRNPLVLSISGSNLSLMTGLPSICDDFGTMQLTTRVATYRPGWFVTWNRVDDDKMEALAPRYNLHRVAEFPVMDDPERNLLILYRLDPPIPSAPLVPHPHKPIPRLLRTSIGQQPSQTQLEH